MWLGKQQTHKDILFEASWYSTPTTSGSEMKHFVSDRLADSPRKYINNVRWCARIHSQIGWSNQLEYKFDGAENDYLVCCLSGRAQITSSDVHQEAVPWKTPAGRVLIWSGRPVPTHYSGKTSRLRAHHGAGFHASGEFGAGATGRVSVCN